MELFLFHHHDVDDGNDDDGDDENVLIRSNSVWLAAGLDR